MKGKPIGIQLSGEQIQVVYKMMVGGLQNNIKQ